MGGRVLGGEPHRLLEVAERAAAVALLDPIAALEEPDLGLVRAGKSRLGHELEAALDLVRALVADGASHDEARALRQSACERPQQEPGGPGAVAALPAEQSAQG